MEMVPPSEPYPPSLYAFFARTTDPMCKYLEENQDPFAFEVFKEVGEDEEEALAAEAVKEFTLRNKDVSSAEVRELTNVLLGMKPLLNCTVFVAN